MTAAKLPRRVLRPVPKDDPRPLPMCEQVLKLAATPFAARVVEWAGAKYNLLDEEKATFALMAAFNHAGPDAFRAGCILRDAFQIPVDMTLVRTLDEVVLRLPSALRIVVGEWVARTGLRFPGKPGDNIEFFDANDCQVAGVVYGLDPTMGLALVTREDTMRTERVCAEQVIANVSLALYDEIKPVLGQRYEDAPALAAAAALEKKRSRAASPVVAPPKLRLVTFTDPNDDPIPPLIA